MDGAGINPDASKITTFCGFLGDFLFFTKKDTILLYKALKTNNKYQLDNKDNFYTHYH